MIRQGEKSWMVVKDFMIKHDKLGGKALLNVHKHQRFYRCSPPLPSLPLYIRIDLLLPVQPIVRRGRQARGVVRMSILNRQGYYYEYLIGVRLNYQQH
jgi:hypothetical protein